MSATRRRNIELLRRTQPRSVRAIEEAEPLPYLTVEAARNGLPNLVAAPQGRPRSLHSRMDPAREAERLAAALSPETGLVVIFGLGAGHHLRSVLSRRAVRAVILCEPDPAYVAGALEIEGIGELLGDTRVTLVTPCSEESAARIVGETYAPLFHRQAAFLPLRGRTDLTPETFATLQSAARHGVERALADFATQRAFGRRWLHNILTNLTTIRRTVEPVPRRGPCIVTAAGPSLERLFREAPVEAGSIIVATDTSLPVLIQRGIRPHFIVTIDSQLASYHHFLRGVPKATILVADVTASPTALRQASRVSLRVGGHPLGRYLARQTGALGDLYTFAGSVTHAAVSFGHEYAAAEEVRVFGADFAYPNGAAYARDSYLHRHFRIKESRLHPTEHAFADFVYRRGKRRTSDRSARPIQDDLHYGSPLLDAYRQNLNALAENLGIRILREPPAGAGDVGDVGQTRRSPTEPATQPAAAAAAGLDGLSPDPEARDLALPPGTELLATYADAAKGLPLLDPQRLFEMESLSADEAELWHTLSPLAATMAECDAKTGIPTAPPAVSLEAARRETLATIHRVLETRR